MSADPPAAAPLAGACLALSAVLALAGELFARCGLGALPHPEAFGVQPVILGTAFLAARTLTVGSSPVAMSTLVTGAFTGQSGARVGLVWNGPYTLAGYLSAAAVLAGAVLLLPVS